jgi:type IV pilus assembly protein PilB
MGVEPFLVTAALNVVIAQRLLRKVCVECKEEDHSVREAEATKLGIRPEQYRKARFVKGKGCPVCKGTGYKGRVAIYETFEFTQEFKEMVLRGETVGQIKKAAYEGGMRSLRQSGILKAMTGVTTLSEAISGTMET